MRRVPEAKPRVSRLISAASSDVSSEGIALWFQHFDLPDFFDTFSIQGFTLIMKPNYFSFQTSYSFEYKRGNLLC